jgi:tRNA-dihydrouridine synthase 4
MIGADSKEDGTNELNSSFQGASLTDFHEQQNNLLSENTEHRRQHPLSTTDPFLKVCAPMVRYSKLPFRELVMSYGTNLAYTPMILCDVFKNSEISRSSEFKTYPTEKVIVQFAASNSLDAADAAQLVARHSNGVDINCGCPQKWAIQEGIGSALMKKPDTVCDIIRQVKRRTACVKMDDGSAFPCSIKIRIHDDINTTIEMAQRAEQMGVDWISVHGRTYRQKNTEPVNWEAVKLVKESVGIPVFFNGDGISNLFSHFAFDR